MSRKELRVGIPALLAVLLGAAVLWIAVSARDDAPRVLRQPQEAVDCAQRMLQAACDGDWEAASEEFYGTPQIAQMPEDPLTQMVWQRYQEFLSFDLPADAQCSISHDGVALDVEIRTLCLEDLTVGLREKFEQQLARRIAEAEDTRDIYDAQGNYLPEVTDDILREVLRERLEQTSQTQWQTVSLSLVYGDGRWWVQPAGQVLDILSGKVGW